MSGNKFAEMSAEEIMNVIDEVQTVTQVDPIFEALKSLDADKYKQVIDFIENYITEIDKDQIAETRQELSALKADDYNLKHGSPEERVGTQAAAQIYFNISQIKGDEAHPLIKAIVQEIAKLSDQGYNSPYKLNSAFLKAYDTTYAPKVSNPFKAAAAPKKPAPTAPSKHRQPKPRGA